MFLQKMHHGLIGILQEPERADEEEIEDRKHGSYAIVDCLRRIANAAQSTHYKHGCRAERSASHPKKTPASPINQEHEYNGPDYRGCLAVERE